MQPLWHASGQRRTGCATLEEMLTPARDATTRVRSSDPLRDRPGSFAGSAPSPGDARPRCDSRDADPDAPRTARLPAPRRAAPEIVRIVRNRRLAPFVLDGSDAFRYTARLRPGGGTADASVSKPISKGVWVRIPPGHHFFRGIPRDHLSCTIESILIESVASDALSSHAQNAPRRSETAIPKNAWPRTRERAGRFRAGSGRSARKEKPASPTGKTGFENPKRKAGASTARKLVLAASATGPSNANADLGGRSIAARRTRRRRSYSANSFSPLNTASASSTV